MSAPETLTVRPGFSVGSTSEFSLFFRVKPGEGEGLRAAPRHLQETPGYRPGDYGMAIASIHEARFVLFDDDTRLAFITSFDGPWDAYMEDFFTSGPTLALFDVIFRHVEGYEGLPDLAAVRAFVLGAQVTAAAYARNSTRQSSLSSRICRRLGHFASSTWRRAPPGKVEGVGTPASSAMSLEEIPAATSVAWASSASCSATAPTSGVGGFAVLARR